MVGGFTLSSLGNETPKTSGVSSTAHLTPEKQPPLRDEKGWFSRKKHTRSGNTDKGVEGREEIRVSRNGRRLVAT